MANLINVDEQLIKEFDKLPLDFWDFKDADIKELTHGIHNYPAVMVYPISRNIIKIVEKYQPVEKILDPFMGSGTVLVEGMVNNFSKVYGNDLNPLAKLIAEVRTTPIEPNTLNKITKSVIEEVEQEFLKYESILSNIDSEINSKFDITERKGWGDRAPEILTEYLNGKIEIPDFKNIGYWFIPSVIIELQLLKKIIKENVDDEEIRKFMLVAFSETVRLVSNRRNGEFKMYRIKKEKIYDYSPDTKEIFINTLLCYVEKMNDFYNVYNKNTEINIVKEDSRVLSYVPDNSIDIMITSPPYGDSRTTVAYGEFSRVSLQWLDLEDKEVMRIDKSLLGGKKYNKGFKFNLESETLENSLAKIKKEDLARAGDVYSFFEDLDKCLKTVTKKMKKNSYQFWVVGNRTVKKETLLTDKILTELGEQYGLIHVITLGRNIPNKVMPSLNSPTNIPGEKVSTMTNEHIVVLRKE